MRFRSPPGCAPDALERLLSAFNGCYVKALNAHSWYRFCGHAHDVNAGRCRHGSALAPTDTAGREGRLRGGAKDSEAVDLYRQHVVGRMRDLDCRLYTGGKPARWLRNGTERRRGSADRLVDPPVARSRNGARQPIEIGRVLDAPANALASRHR